MVHHSNNIKVLIIVFLFMPNFLTVSYASIVIDINEIMKWKRFSPAKELHNKIGQEQKLGLCSSRSGYYWIVDSISDTIHITKKNFSEYRQDRFVDIFDIKKVPKIWFHAGYSNLDAKRKVTNINGGFLVGYNAGEFGKAIVWYSSDFKQHEIISTEYHVVDFVWIENSLYALTGLSHMQISEGKLIAIRIYRFGIFAENTGITIDNIIDLPSDTPESFVLLEDNSLLVFTARRIFHLWIEGRKEIVYESTYGLPAASVARLNNGVIFLGGHGLVARLTPNGNSYEEEWFLPPEVADCYSKN